jgi:SmpA / OmlA family
LSAISKTIVGHAAVLVLLLAIAGGAMAACRDGADKIKPGMNEKQVRQLLGEPTFVVTNPNDVRAYLVGASDCRAISTQVLVYDRVWFREDIFVGIDNVGLVTCRRGGQVVRAAI